MSEKEDDGFLMVAAIDFGTTYSGYGFSFKTQPDVIQMAKNWGEEFGHQSYKTPTSLLVDNNGKFKGTGKPIFKLLKIPNDSSQQSSKSSRMKE